MQERHTFADHQQPLGLVRSRSREPDAESLGRAPHEQRVVDGLRRSDQQKQTRLLGERLESPQETLLDPPGQRVRPRQPERARQLRRRQTPRQLEDRQRIAARLRDEPVADALIETPWDDRRQQGARVVLREPCEPELGQPQQLAPVGRVAHREHDRHRLGQQPSRDESENLPRGAIEPLGIIDKAEQRPLRGNLGQQAERGQGDQEAARSRTGRPPQRDAQGDLLRLWKRPEPTQHRRAELMQSGERQLDLGLDPGDPRDAETGCLPRAVMQERRLADARLAADDQDRALAGADVLQQPVEQRTLVGSAQQHRRTAPGHPLTLNDQGWRARESTGATAGDRGQGCCVSRTDPVAIVTGGSRGAGREIARELGSRSYAVVVVYLRDQGKAEAAVEEIVAANGTALAVRANVTDELDVERLFDETKAAFGGVDVVVHAAMRATSVVNQQAARQLSDGGAIVNVSSSAIASDIADELRARDITLNGLSPGLEPPGTHHDIAELLALLDRWRRAPGE